MEIPIGSKQERIACRLTNQHQVFGHFSGKAILDNGQEIRVQNLLGFAEKVYNRW